MPEPKLIELKYKGICARCRCELMPGDKGYFSKAPGQRVGSILCVACYQDKPAK